jgi:hypothetical protein
MAPTYQHCCSSMRAHLERHCPLHPSPFDCPDSIVYFDEDREQYGLIIHDGGTSVIAIAYCPWCGAALSSPTPQSPFEDP